MNRGAIILCGGQSTRMGSDKASLPFGPQEAMLQRVVRLVAEAVSAERIICVASVDQQLPTLPADVRIARDIEPNQGPLTGLATGFKSSANRIDAVLAVGCDAPLLIPAFVRHMFDLLGDDEIVATHDGQRWHPLPAVYRTRILPQVESLLAEGKRSLVALLESAHTRRVTTTELLNVDPHLKSLFACNLPADYQSALSVAGFSLR